MKIAFAKTVFLAASVFLISLYIDFEELYAYSSSIDVFWVLVSFSFIFMNQFLSSIRFSIMLSLFEVKIDFWKIHKVNIYSLFSGFLFFNFFGQSISRSYLVNRMSDPESSFIITALERVISLSMLLLVAISLSAYVFGNISVYIPSLPILMALGFIVISLLLFYFFMLFPRQRNEINLLLSSGLGRRIWGVVFLVFLMHLSMLAAYICLIFGMADEVVLNENSILASVLTMLGGALPISFGGWGAREMSASFAFKATSLPIELGVSAGIGVGLLTLCALAVNLLFVCGVKQVNHQGVKKQEVSKSGLYSKRLILLLSWVAAPVLIVLMTVQVPVPLRDGHLTVNLADPLAIVFGMTFVLVLIQNKAWGRVWLDRKIGYWFLAAGGVLLVSYLIGFVRFGYSEWALYNRLIGGGILFSYLLVGVVAVAFWGEFGVRVAVKAIAICAIVLAMTEYFFRLVLGFESAVALGWNTYRWTGFLSNPNSYAFFFLSVFPFVFCFLPVRKKNDFYVKCIFLSVVLAIVFFSMSKAAFLSLSLLSILFLIYDWRTFLLSIVGAFAFYWSVILLNELTFFIEDGDYLGVMTRVGQNRMGELFHVQSDRIESLVEGWKMFIEHPLFGAGLGAFYESQSVKGTPLVIHNSFLWVLAEMGMFGFLILIVPPALFSLRILWNSEWRRNPYFFSFLVVLMNASIMGMAHELVYQRIFWLISGLLLASPFVLRSRTKL